MLIYSNCMQLYSWLSTAIPGTMNQSEASRRLTDLPIRSPSFRWLFPPGFCHLSDLPGNSYTLLHDRIDIHAVSPMTNTEYFVGGSTALLDAIGLTINKLVSVQRNTAEDYRADKVMFVIITDGEENSSREYSADKVRSMIEHEKEKYGWEFIFLGANIDAVQTAQRFGIDADRAVDYIPDAKGTQLNFEAMAETVACYRMTGAVPAEPMEEIRKDMKKRGGRK